MVWFLLRSFRYVAPLLNVDYRNAHRSLYNWLFPCAYVLRMVNAWLTVSHHMPYSPTRHNLT